MTILQQLLLRLLQAVSSSLHTTATLLLFLEQPFRNSLHTTATHHPDASHLLGAVYTLSIAQSLLDAAQLSSAMLHP